MNIFKKKTPPKTALCCWHCNQSPVVQGGVCRDCDVKIQMNYTQWLWRQKIGEAVDRAWEINR